MQFLRSLLLVLAVATLGFAGARPRLLVVVSVDQLSADLVARWGQGLPGGLGRLLREGAWFTAAYHEHGYSDTGPGHSVLLSGRHPGHTGIPENYWYDRSSRDWVYCVDDPDVQVLGSGRTPGSGPRWFQGRTLAGWLKDQVPGARAFAVSGKDRSAILTLGARADGVYWLENQVGFTTSTAYARELPVWLRDRNRAFLDGLREASLVWEALDPADASVRGGRYQLPGRTVVMGLPRLVKGVGMPLDDAFWLRFRATPKLDEAVLETAEALIDREGLGRGKGTDLLVVGLASTDYIGHHFGNAGPEMRDQIRRLDRGLGGLLERLRKVDPGAWVVLTADHGCTDFCERLQEQGIGARRGSHSEFFARVEGELAAALGAPGPYLHAKAGTQQLWLREDAVRPGGPTRQRILEAAAAVLRRQPEIAGAWTAEELAALQPAADEGPDRRSIAERVRLSQMPGRSGDLLLALAPFFTFDEPPYVVSHGNPWDYDRRVPLVFWGPWKAEVRGEPVRTVDLAPTLAKELGLKVPDPIDGKALALSPGALPAGR